MAMTFDAKDAVTLVIASVGAVLGVLNTWRAFDRDRPKLRVRPKQAIPVGAVPDPRTRLCLDITNLSNFPLTVSEVGVLYRGTKARGAVPSPVVFDGGSFPRRLEPRTSFTVYFHPDAFAHIPHRARCAYATTDCGLTFKGRGPALDLLANRDPV